MSNSDFGRYSLIKKLATGGMAEVYLAHQKGPEGFQKHLVIKKILPHLAADEEFVAMFLNEARIAARFSHPNIVQIYDLGKQGDSYYIAMEYIHGEDLGRVMKQAWATNRWLPPQIALKMIAGAAEGLHYAHTKCDEHGRPLKVVHRDISPQNIIVTFDGGVKLVDFGIARAVDQASHTATGAIKGKFAYMAPEQATGKPVDHRTDIFALGLVLYELLTGVRPFKRDSDIATLRAVLDCEVQPPSMVARLTPGLDEVVMKALARHAEDRYQDARQFQQALETFILEQRWSASTIDVSEFMKATFSERLQEESRLGRPDPRGAESASGMAVAPQFSPSLDSELNIPRLASNEFELAEPSMRPPTRRRSTRGQVAVSHEANARIEEAWQAAQQEPVDDDPHWDRATEAALPPVPEDPWARAADSRPGFGEDDEDEATLAEPGPQVPDRARRSREWQRGRAAETMAGPAPQPMGRGRPSRGRRPTTGVPGETAVAPLPRERRRARVASGGGRRRSVLLMSEDELLERQMEEAEGSDEPSEISLSTAGGAPEAGRQDEAEWRSPLAVAEMHGPPPARKGGAAKFALLLGVIAGLGIAGLALAPRLREMNAAASSGFDPNHIAYLTLHSNVPVEVRVGEELLGHSPLREVPIPAGETTLTLQNHNFGIQRQITLSAEREEVVNHEESFDLGKLQVLADKPCDVYINGRRVAQSPGPPFDFFEGSYDVECRNEPLGLLGRAHVKIRSGRAKPVEVKIPLRPM